MWGLVSSASLEDSIRTEKRKEGLFIIHKVEEEETIYSIAKRYQGGIKSIIQYNNITNNRIEIGQIISVLVEKGDIEMIEISDVRTESGYHLVESGQTLYGISKKHNVSLRDLRKWNNLENDTIFSGTQLKVKPEMRDSLYESTQKNKSKNILAESPSINESKVSDDVEGFDKYSVQAGETLFTISSKIGVTIDSIRIWNELEKDYLAIGQELVYRKINADLPSTFNQTSSNPRIQLDSDGFQKVYEEGIASLIAAMNTSKYLALHRDLPIGTDLEVRNLMNNQIVHVKVIGKLPDIGLNKNILLRLSQSAYDQLGILDSKSRVEVSYFKE